MKLVSFGPAGQERPGALLGDDRILDLQAASGDSISSIRALLDHEQDGRAQVARWLADPAADAIVTRAGTRLGPALTNPTKIIGLGLNYKSHTEEQSAKQPKRPLLFSKSTTSLAGDGDPIWHPVDEKNLDYEAELGVVIGKPGLRIEADRWRDYVAGYTVVNDISARDAQFQDRKWFRGKSPDSCCPLGPWIVTADEIEDPHDLRVTARLNGEKRQDANTKDLIFDIPATLEFVSRNITLLPGDVIATGTPGGVGIFMDPVQCMKVGDVIVVEVEKIGKLTNQVCARNEITPSVYPHPRH
jgi:2-keto-4-pentenoate hydratase/2-oxohepta-3-ene-1,7-dioic acid hydratase in catechol pathway